MSSFKACCCRHIRCLLLGIHHARHSSIAERGWLPVSRRRFLLRSHPTPSTTTPTENLAGRTSYRWVLKSPLSLRQQSHLPSSGKSMMASNQNEAMHARSL